MPSSDPLALMELVLRRNEEMREKISELMATLGEQARDREQTIDRLYAELDKLRPVAVAAQAHLAMTGATNPKSPTRIALEVALCGLKEKGSAIRDQLRRDGVDR